MSDRASTKKVLGVYSQPDRHWVGDGFHVRTLFSYEQHAQSLSPFLLLDYAGPTTFPPTLQRRGVGEHPHRGFETVTIVYQGELEHRDSSGGGGRIGPGDVQWMTAGCGILHEEFHAESFARAGGTLEMVQLWVNLPARDKRAAPRYQSLLARDIPVVDIPDEAGQLRVIAGRFGETRGPARTWSPIDVFDVRLSRGKALRLDVLEHWSSAVVVLRGSLRVNGAELAGEGQWVQLGRAGTMVELVADADATALVLSGEQLDEPVVGFGPFVMNERREIAEAIEDFEGGRFGQIAAEGA